MYVLPIYEYMDGLSRQYLPKAESMTSLTQQQCDLIELKLDQEL